MLFILRTAFWLALVIIVLPDISNKQDNGRLGNLTEADKSYVWSGQSSDYQYQLSHKF